MHRLATAILLAGLLAANSVAVRAQEGGPAEAGASDEGDQPVPLVWTRLGRPLGGGAARDYATLPDGSVLAVGSLGASARAWHSADGITWEEVRPPGHRRAVMSSVSSADHGIIATGTREGSTPRDRVGVVWTSEDGLDWRERHTFPDAWPVEAIATQDGYAVVTHQYVDDVPTHATAWHSATGDEWEPWPIYDSQVQVAFAAELPATGAWVTVGMEWGTGVPRLWRSDDGRTWEAVEPPWPESQRIAGPLVATPTGFLLTLVRPPGLAVDEVGRTRHKTIWHSLDGRDWTVAAVSEQNIVPMTVGPAGILGLATPFDRGGPKGDWPVSLLRSQDGFAWTTEEVPALKGLPMKRLVAMPDGRMLAIRALRDITWLGQPADAPPIPEPTPSGRAPALSFKALVNSGEHPDGDLDEVADDIVEYFEMMGDKLDPVDLERPTIDERLRSCKQAMLQGGRRDECVDAFSLLHRAYGVTRDPGVYELADRFLGVTMNDQRAEWYLPMLREGIRWNNQSYPGWFKD